MAATTSRVTGNEGVLTTLTSADAARTIVLIVNDSGVDLAVYISGQTEPFDTIPPSPKNKNKLAVSGDLAQVAIKGKTVGGALAAHVTIAP